MLPRVADITELLAVVFIVFIMAKGELLVAVVEDRLDEGSKVKIEDARVDGGVTV